MSDNPLIRKTSFDITVDKQIDGRIQSIAPITVKNQIAEIGSITNIPGINSDQMTNESTLVYNANTGAFDIRLLTYTSSLNVSNVLQVSTISANGSYGLSGSILVSDGDSVYWSSLNTANVVTNIVASNGLSGGGSGNTITLSVDPSYITTLDANNATYLGGKSESQLAVGYSDVASNANYADVAYTAMYLQSKSESELSVNAAVYSTTANNATYLGGKSENQFNVNSATTSTFAFSANDSLYLNGKSENQLSVNFALTSDSSNFALTANGATYLSGKSEDALNVNSATYSTNSIHSLTADSSTTAFGKNENQLNVNSASISTFALSTNTATFLNGKSENTFNVNSSVYSTNSQYSSTANNSTYLNGKDETYFTNAYNITTGTLSELRLPYRIDQDLRKTDNVEFHDLIITGNVHISGNVTTIAANNIVTVDNMFYLNANAHNVNPDIGFTAGYNDGNYHHAGFFRDASDGVWKVFDNYDPEPDASIYIDTANSSFHLADFQANTGYFSRLEVGNSSVFGIITANVFTGTANNTTYAFNKSEPQLNVNSAVYSVVSNNSVYVFGKSENRLNVNSSTFSQTSNNSAYAFGKSENTLNVNSSVYSTNSLTSNNSTYLGGSTWASPQSIGSVSANSARFTTITATDIITYYPTSGMLSIPIAYNPEGRFAAHPALLNDLANATRRGGTITHSTATVYGSVDLLVDGLPSFFMVDTASPANLPFVITMTLPSTLYWKAFVGVCFSRSGYRSNTVKIEAFSEGAWVTCYNNTAFADEQIIAEIPGNAGIGTTMLRWTFDNPQTVSSSGLRISHLFAFHSGSDGWSHVMMPRAGGSFYGSISANGAIAGGNTTITGFANVSSTLQVAGLATFNSNVVLNAADHLVLSPTSGISANGSFGSSGQVLTTNGSSVYWSTVSGGGGGDITSVTAGSGLTGGGTSGDVTLTVKANTGIVVDAGGVSVNSAYIATLNSNNATFLNGKSEATLNVNSATFAGSANNTSYAFGKTENQLNVNSATFAGSANNSAYLNGFTSSYFNDAANLTGTLSESRLPNTSVVAGTYGNTTSVPVITVDNKGRINSISTATISAGGGGSVDTAAQYTWTNTHTFNANVTFNFNLIANGSSGTAGQVLTASGNGMYWSTPTSGGGITTGKAIAMAMIFGG